MPKMTMKSNYHIHKHNSWPQMQLLICVDAEDDIFIFLKANYHIYSYYGVTTG